MSYTAVSTLLFAAVCIALFLLRRRLGLFASSSLLLAAGLSWLKFGISPPVPASAFNIYAFVVVASVLVYVTSSEAGREAFFGPLVRMMTQNRQLPLLLVVLLVVPGVVAWKAHAAFLPSSVPPPKIRIVHPPPPNSISVLTPGMSEAHVVDLASGRSPFAGLQTSDPAAFAARVAQGKVVYYQNCFWCHGDTLSADGHYAAAVAPPPATFQDAGVIPQLQASFLYWRIAKGGPGLPDDATPFDSSMPAWERFLSEEDMWSAVLFLSDYTGFQPRSNAPAAGDHQ